MRAIIVAAATSAALIANAGAADLPRAMPVKAPVAIAEHSWAGHYIGLFAGYAWGRANATSAFDSASGFFYNWTGNPYGFDANGFFAGVTFGSNWQSGAFVFGLEAELGYLGISGSRIDPNFQPGTTPIPDTRTKFDSDFYAALYARAGAAVGAALYYVKAGAAFLNAKASTIDPCGDGSALCGSTTLTMTSSKWLTGWTVGTGAEWMVGSQWSAKVEYAYFDFGSIGTAGPSNVAGEFYRQTIDVKVHTVKLGLNWRFGPSLVSSRY